MVKLGVNMLLLTDVCILAGQMNADVSREERFSNSFRDRSLFPVMRRKTVQVSQS